MKRRILLLFSLFFLWGCAAEEPAAPEIKATAVPEIKATAAPTVAATEPMQAAPTEVQMADVIIDYTHQEEGYVSVRYGLPTEKRLKARVVGPNTTYTYNLPVDQWAVFPLSDGNGTYTVTIYINTHDTKYAAVMTEQFDVTLKDEFAPFLRPNQYVDYSNAPATTAKAEELCEGLTDPLEKVAAVYDFVVDTLAYDQQRAETVQSGYLPVLDQVLEEEKGICFDYASLMTAMLRTQEVPCKLVVGYAGDIYHAWISVWTESHGWVDGAIFFDGQSWKRMDPTFASSGNRSAEMMELIENGNYTVKYLY